MLVSQIYTGENDMYVSCVKRDGVITVNCTSTTYGLMALAEKQFLIKGGTDFFIRFRKNSIEIHFEEEA